MYFYAFFDKNCICKRNAYALMFFGGGQNTLCFGALITEEKMSKTYEAKDIQVLEGLDAVRMRPGMYIGTTGNKGLHHLLWEIVDNAVDEATNGFADKIEITLHRDDSVTVSDNGRDRKSVV